MRRLKAEMNSLSDVIGYGSTLRLGTFILNAHLWSVPGLLIGTYFTQNFKNNIIHDC